MFNIGTSELVVIVIVAIIVVGPAKLPQIMRTLGKGLAEFKRMSSDVKDTFETELNRIDREEQTKAAAKAEAKAAPAPETAAPPASEPAAAQAPAPDPAPDQAAASNPAPAASGATPSGAEGRA